ncbi:YbhB/YbcL family Raf kinase inhibitor-like protein [Pectobacterium versatile]|nr:YbhB/YbcL family Raf kinase inhibitor-like protein [Pectobacterium versatile]
MEKIILGLSLLSCISGLHAQPLKLTSTDVRQGEQVKDAYVLNGSGCTGKNISPQLSWSGAPAETKSFAITMFDSDAPTGSGWWHWSLVNIPKEINSVARNAGSTDGKNIPVGAVQGRTDFGGPGFGGPCPPSGDATHHYHFKIWALKVDKLPVDKDSGGALVGYMLNSNSIASAELVPVSVRPAQ